MRSHDLILKPHWVRGNKAKGRRRNGRRQGERTRLRPDEEQAAEGLVGQIK